MSYNPSAGVGSGTVTSVSGTGTVSGLTLSGTVTTSGNLSLGGTLSTTASAVSDFGTAADARVAAGIATHEAASDPHPGYLTTAEGAAAFQALDSQLTSLGGLLYTGNAGEFIRVNAGETGFELVAIAGGGDVVGDDTSTTDQNIVAYVGTGGKNITELTGAQGDILYRDATSWAKLGAGTVGQYLETNGSGANPSWQYGAVIHSSTSSGVTTTGANTTPVSVSGAVFSYVANAVYRIWVMGRLNSTAATTGAGIHFNLSTAVTAIDVNTYHAIATTGTANVAYSISDDASEGVTSAVPTGPLDVPVTTNALLVTGANTGTCQLRLRSETTAVTELLAGTVMVVERIA